MLGALYNGGMGGHLPSVRTLVLFSLGIAVGVFGVTVEKSGKLPTSFSDIKATLAQESGVAPAGACTSSQKNNDVYFVSCGGFF